MQELLHEIVFAQDIQDKLGVHAAVRAAILELLDGESFSVVQTALAEAAAEEVLTDSEPYSTLQEGPLYFFSQCSSQGTVATPSNSGTQKRSRTGGTPPQLSQVSQVSAAESTTPANTLCSQLSTDPADLTVHEYAFPVPDNDPVKDLLGVTSRLPWSARLPAKVARARYRAGLDGEPEEDGTEQSDVPAGALGELMRLHCVTHNDDDDDGEDDDEEEGEDEQEQHREDEDEEGEEEEEEDEQLEGSDDDFMPRPHKYFRHTVR
eukprot:CAMPEP_0181317768 /NCGR_PEP_ID=MMETSP1101-20121128/16645_1 /TAXON_ID=46948 /ORGANISM="Rhodomonas abbreviata, Strain Caron Lab Isolate" /LENGTH=263 /DNA_ID=CAMNT_0023425185 /DNA_START=140 /DNA_END=931 /DNA_ORIENTATION=+